MTDRVAGLPYTAVYKGLNLILAQDTDIVPNIVGHGGIGKSQMVRDLAKHNGFGYFEITCSLLQPGDLTMPVPKEDHIQYYLNPQIQGAITEAKANPNRKVILFLDEFNRPIAMVQGELMNLVLQRNLMGQYLPDNVVIITAENPSSDVEGFENTSYATNARDMAINDRTMRIRMGANLEDWLTSFAKKTRTSNSSRTMIHPLITEFLQADGRQYFIIIDETRDKNPTPRGYERLSNLLYAFEDAGQDIYHLTDDYLEFLIEGIEGNIGDEAGQVFVTFLRQQQTDFIKPTEIVQAHGSDLDQAILDRYQAMPIVRRKRVIEDLTDYIVNQPNLIEDKHLISRYTDIFTASEPDEIYILIKRMHDGPDDSAMANFYKALNQHPDFVEKTFDITMAVNANQ